MKFPAGLCGVLLVLWAYSSSVSGQDYDYSNGPNGPANWGKFGPTCKRGTHQSPINITTPLKLVRHNPLHVVTNFSIIPCEIYNNGHTPTVEINAGVGAQFLRIWGRKYGLKDFHFHIKSEHKLFGTRYAMEMHMVHESTTRPRKVAVIALLYEIGQKSNFLAQFFGSLPPFSPKNVRSPINITLLSLENVESYYQYNGSLTTPPCDEDVAWVVVNKIYTLSGTQLHQLRVALPEENARPIQARNGRIIYLNTKN